MRVTRQQAAENRSRILVAAARLLRECGIDGVGIDVVAEAAGLTHGAVYSHFKSKDALAAEAVGYALDQSFREWLDQKDGLDGHEALARLVRVYVSRAHRDDPGIGCSIAVLGGNSRGSSTALKKVLSRGVATLVDAIAKLARGRSEQDRRAAAILNAATMIGAVVMARAAIADEKLSEEILMTVRGSLIGGA